MKEGNEKLEIIEAKTERAATQKLFNRFIGKPFAAMKVGKLNKNQLMDMITPESKLSNPIQVISAIRFTAQEYEEILSQADIKALARVADKITKDFFTCA